MRAVWFFWSAAVTLSLWELFADPLLAERQTVVCMSGVPMKTPQPHAAAVAAEVLGALLIVFQPILLALAALWALRSRARADAALPGRTASFRPAALGLAFALLPVALTEAGDRLSPEPPLWWRECLEAQLAPPSLSVPRMILAWLLSPAAMVLLAGIAGAGVRPRLTDLRNTGIAATAVVLAVLLPGALIGLPANADGTPRYALIRSFFPYVLDLESGELMDQLPEATRAYGDYAYIAADTEPGHYVAAISNRSGRHFRLYRLTMSADGRVTVGERLTPSIRGTAIGLALSSEGRIAYGRSTDEGRFVGTLEREWPVSGYGLQWLDTRRLALPEHSTPASTLATLDVETGEVRNVAAPAEHEFSRPLLVLPGGRQVRALGWPTRTLVLHEGTRMVRRLLDLDCGHIESLKPDPTGRHLLVGVDREAEEMDRSPLTGLPPCGGAASQLLRIDVESGTSRIVPGEQMPYVEAW
ncbi:hypothetical protein AB0G15_40895 [Streptosporangium sp. NPDC023825]|uniref:hypothetical protein n=1 Tax=Streptosporangium sp. NPDC023825 TaxID=3154909 RepID=UPI0034132295